MMVKYITTFVFFGLCLLQISWGHNTSQENDFCTIQDESISYFTTTAQTPPDTTMEYISVPNAFMPYYYIPELAIFKPMVHHEITNYTMLIYNRWGSLLFEAKTPDEGWNGKYKGVVCPVQAYVYKITYKPVLPDGSLGEERVRTGTINLLE